MTAEEYIEQQCNAFEEKILSMGITEKFIYKAENVDSLDSIKLDLWGPQGPPDSEIAELSIMWGAVFTRIISLSYESQWTVDPESNVPVVVVKCGNRAMQIKAIVVVTQAFREGQPLGPMWKELEEHLAQNGAVKK